MERDSFVFYRSFYEAIKCLTPAEQLNCFNAIAQYALDGEEPQVEGAAKGIFLSVKPQIDANNRRYVNGCKGGKPKANQKLTKSEPKANQKQTKPEPNENENVNENVNDNDNENVNVNVNENVNEKNSGNKSRRFTPPSREEVQAYCVERNNGIDAQAFIDFYISKGWMVGKNPMKDWKAAVRTWERRHDNKQSNITNGFFKVDDDFFRRKMEGL